MGVYILYKGNHFFIDCLANHSHDHHFTRAGWQRVLSILESMDIKVGEVVKKVIIWSDGGLKTKENLYTFHEIAIEKKITIWVNFLGPYHGHSEVRILFKSHNGLHDDSLSVSVMGTLERGNCVFEAKPRTVLSSPPPKSLKHSNQSSPARKTPSLTQWWTWRWKITQSTSDHCETKSKNSLSG